MREERQIGMLEYEELVRQKNIGHAKEIVLYWDGLSHDATFVVRFFEWEPKSKVKLMFHLTSRSEGYQTYCLVEDGKDPWDYALLQFHTTHRTKSTKLFADCLTYLREQFTPFGEKESQSVSV